MTDKSREKEERSSDGSVSERIDYERIIEEKDAVIEQLKKENKALLSAMIKQAEKNFEIRSLLEKRDS